MNWRRFLVVGALLLAALPARADDLSTRAAAVKGQLKAQWLPALAERSPANESASDAANLLFTLSHAHRLGYSTNKLRLLDAARVHYRLLRDSRRDHGGFFESYGAPIKSTLLQAQVIAALVEYARASGQSEPRALAAKTWLLLRDRAQDNINGGYFEAFVTGPLAPTQASGAGDKRASSHLMLLEAASALYELTRDQSIKRDLQSLLDLNEGRFYPVPSTTDIIIYSVNWKARPVVDTARSGSFPDYVRAAAVIARARRALDLPTSWVDVTRRAAELERPGSLVYAAGALDTLSLLAQSPSARERRAAQIDELLNSLGGATPDARADRSLLDFVAAFESPSP